MALSLKWTNQGMQQRALTHEEGPPKCFCISCKICTSFVFIFCFVFEGIIEQRKQRVWQRALTHVGGFNSILICISFVFLFRFLSHLYFDSDLPKAPMNCIFKVTKNVHICNLGQQVKCRISNAI